MKFERLKVPLMAVALASLAVFTASCGRTEKPGPLEKAGRAADEAVDKASAAAKEAAAKAKVKGEELKDKAERAAEKVGEGAEKVGEAVKETAGNVKREIQKGEQPRPTPVTTPLKFEKR
jgi:hypothetical protein